MILWHNKEVKQPKKVPKISDFVDTDSDTKDDEEKEPVAKRMKTLTKKASKSTKPANTDLEDSDDYKEGKKPVVKKAPKSPGLVEINPENSEDSDTKYTLRAIGINNSLEVGKNEQEPILKKGIYRGKKYHMLQNLILTGKHRQENKRGN